jgi:CRISPR-associated exonuclease Cas4
LIHVEQIWAENSATAQGRLLHERVDAGRAEARPAAFTERNVALRSWALGVVGRADVVEYVGSARRPAPVEYKRGKPKGHRADEIQLCAQAICLEEMLSVVIPEGSLFYGETRRRQRVVFDSALRRLTAQTAQAARAMITAGHTPPPVHTAACRACSLEQACQPRRLQGAPAIARWLIEQIAG